MNERIRELESQCWEDVPVDIDYDYLSRVRRVFNREKFAELILTDVLDILATYRARVEFYDGFEHNCEHPITAICKHFGFKE